MIKVNSQNILRGVIVGLGVILIIIALAIVEIRVAGQNFTNNVQPILCGSDSKTGAPCTGLVEVENTKIQYNIIKEGIPDGSGGVYQSLTFTHDQGKDQTQQTVFSVLKDLADKNKFDLEYNYNFPKLGVLVDSIAGIKSGTDGKYWQYYINGKLGDLAADKKEVKAGDKVEWKFEKVPEF